MRKIIALLLILIFIFTYSIVKAQSSGVIINEFLPNPDGSDLGYEWVEFRNTTNQTILISGWKLENESASGSIRTLNIPDIQIAPYKHFILAEHLVTYSGTNITFLNNNQKIDLYNSNSKLRLKDSLGTIVDEISYSTSSSGKSFERTGELCANLLVSDSNSIGIKNSNLDQSCYSDPFKEIKIMFSYNQQDWQESAVFTNAYEQIYFKLNKDSFEGQWSNQNSIIKDNYITKETTILEFKNEDFTISNSNIFNLENIYFNEFFVDSNYTLFLEIYSQNSNVNTLDNLYIQHQGNNHICEFSEVGFCVIELSGYDLNKPFAINFDNNILQDLILPDWNYKNSYGLYNNKLVELEPTIGDSNILPIDILITEAYPSPSNEETEWIEIYNSGSSLNLTSDFCLKEFNTETNEYKTEKYCFESTLLAQDTHLLVEKEIFTFSLNNSGDHFGIFYKNQLLDDFKYSYSVKAGQSVSKIYKNTYTSEYIKPELNLLTPNNFNKQKEFAITEFAELGNFDIDDLVQIKAIVFSIKNDYGLTKYILWDNSYGFIDFKNLNIELKSGDNLIVNGVVKSDSEGQKYILCDIKSICDISLSNNSTNFLYQKSDSFTSDSLIDIDLKLNRLYTKSATTADLNNQDVKIIFKSISPILSKNASINVKGLSIFSDDSNIIYVSEVSQIPDSNTIPDSEVPLTESKNSKQPDSKVVQNMPKTYTESIQKIKNYDLPQNYSIYKSKDFFESDFLKMIIWIAVINLFVGIFFFTEYLKIIRNIKNYFRSNLDYLEYIVKYRNEERQHSTN